MKTIIEDRNYCIDAAKRNGYKYISYTYSLLQEAKEDSPSWNIFSTEEELHGYVCEIWDLAADDIIVHKEGASPFEARKEAMADYARIFLGDTIDHNLGHSAIDGVQVLSIAQAIASRQPVISDVPKATGDIVKGWLKKHNISQTEAAKLCSVTPRTFRRWIADKPSIPTGMMELLNRKVREINPWNMTNIDLGLAGSKIGELTRMGYSKEEAVTKIAEEWGLTKKDIKAIEVYLGKD